MKEQVFCYCDKTETIRLMPSNRLVAHKAGCVWICQPDLAVPVDMAVKCFKALMVHEIKYGTGLELLAAITPSDTIKIEALEMCRLFCDDLDKAGQLPTLVSMARDIIKRADCIN